MSKYEKQIRQFTIDMHKTINSSEEEIEQFKKQCKVQIKQIVDKVKSDIMNSAKEGNIYYIEEEKNIFLLNKKKKIKKMPHYFSNIELYYSVNIRESVCEYKRMSYYDYDYDKPVFGFEVNSYEIIQYIIKKIIKSLSSDNIYPVDRHLNQMTKYSYDTYKTSLEFMNIKKNFKVTKKEKNVHKPVFEHRMTFAFFL